VKRVLDMRRPGECIAGVCKRSLDENCRVYGLSYGLSILSSLKWPKSDCILSRGSIIIKSHATLSASVF